MAEEQIKTIPGAPSIPAEVFTPRTNIPPPRRGLTERTPMTAPHPDRLASVLRPLVGARIPGGCDSCDAYQEVRPDEIPGVWHIDVSHDDWCPVIANREQRRARRRAKRN